MTQDLTQKWLAEIQALKQQLAELQQQRDQAWETSQKWQQRYNTESEQRRADAKMYQQAIASVKAELQKLQGINADNITETGTETIAPEVSQLSSVEELKAQLIALTQERDRLIQALKTEQENHEQTRNNLTTALGDAIDSLTKLRAASQRAEEAGEVLGAGEAVEE
jgi:DNA repair exonuclease SbcCD ATPase subunit